MKRFGLIGHQISYSKSPLIQQLIATYLSRDISYEIIDINEEMLFATLEQLRKGVYDGFNVTIPYKILALDYVDLITERARKIGAINTIYMKDGKMIGDNTDYDGFKYLFQYFKCDKQIRALILGSGGASKACQTVFDDLNIKYFVVSRKKSSLTISYDSLDTIDYQLVVNTTPLGSENYLGNSPLEKKDVINKDVIDLIYIPKVTPLMNMGKASINGQIMLVVQAYYAQALWYNEPVNQEQLKAFIKSLEGTI